LDFVAELRGNEINWGKCICPVEIMAEFLVDQVALKHSRLIIKTLGIKLSSCYQIKLYLLTIIIITSNIELFSEKY